MELIKFLGTSLECWLQASEMTEFVLEGSCGFQETLTAGIGRQGENNCILGNTYGELAMGL